MLHRWTARWTLLAALRVLVVAVAAGVVTMHAPLLGALSAPGSSASAHASMHLAAGGAASTTTHPSPAPTSSEDELCHSNAAGHGQHGSTHAAGCDLSAPPLGGASVLGAAALVAVVVLALFVFSASSAPRGGWQRRGPPAGDRLRLSLCVIRV